jgi:hypothetical protein
MRKPLLLLFAFLALKLFAVPMAAQNAQTGTITGRVSAGGEGLPGVTVIFESPAMQGVREVVTQTNGDYISPFLPPGTYSVTFTLEGFRTLIADNVKVSIQQTRRLDAQMVDEAFEGEIEIVGTGETISQNIGAQTTVPLEFQEKLAIKRTITQAALLVPGVVSVGGRISVSGGTTNDNLWLINGVVVNENTSGNPLPLYIEDAVLETTTSTSGISAEYGRFQGGVVNMLTKSGGNRFSGSLRADLSNDKWVARTELSPERLDDISTVYEATLGGFILEDALWFFLAARDTSFSENRTTNETRLPYPYTDKNQRYEAKMTWSITKDHRIVGSYSEIGQKRTNTDYGDILDYASLNPKREDKQTMFSLNYTGVVTETLFLEGLYSRRDYTMGIGAGSPYTDIIRGTLLLDRSSGPPPARYHTPTFCSAPECLDTERNNKNWYLKASWFAAGDKWGTHDIVLGVDQFLNYRRSDNHQQGSDFRIYGSATIRLDDPSEPGGVAIYPVFAPWGDPKFSRDTYYMWNPIFAPPNYTDFKTNSLFVNDSWRLNNHWSFNLGLRYDENDGVDGAGSKVADDSRLTPRLGAAFDIRGDGGTVINASYSQYTALLPAIGNVASDAGRPADVSLEYHGPRVNAEAYLSGDYSNLVTQDEAIAIWYEWFLANGGTENPPYLMRGWFPGFSPQILESLDSHYATEYSIGITQRLGSSGLLRLDFVYRDYDDFFMYVTEPGRTVDTGYVGEVDLETLENDERGLHYRTYSGLHSNFQYRLGNRWELGASWTYSAAKGNISGFQSNVGGYLLRYPEYLEQRWAAPDGRLIVDQPNRLRSWVVWDAISTRRHSLSASVLFIYLTGTNFSKTIEINPRSYVTNPGYITPPKKVDYYLGPLGSERWDDYTRTDLALNYGFTVGGVQLFAQFDLLNVFNEQAQMGGNTTINQLQDFNPFTEEPVQGVHWEYGPNYREPTSENDFQSPRTFRLSLGVRF